MKSNLTQSRFPQEMWVSDDKITWHKRLVFAKIKTNYPYISNTNRPEEAKDCQHYAGWKYAKKISQTKKIKYVENTI